eukprot:3661495-Amphidinium_carterae.3
MVGFAWLVVNGACCLMRVCRFVLGVAGTLEGGVCLAALVFAVALGEAYRGNTQNNGSSQRLAADPTVFEKSTGWQKPPRQFEKPTANILGVSEV